MADSMWPIHLPRLSALRPFSAFRLLQLVTPAVSRASALHLHSGRPGRLASGITFDGARIRAVLLPRTARGPRGADNGRVATRRPRAAFPCSLALSELLYQPVRLVYAYIRAEQKRFRESVVNTVTARVQPERNSRRGDVHEGA